MDQFNLGKIPKNKEIETFAIGAMVKDNSSLYYGVNELSEDDFYDEINSFNFKMIKDAYEDSGEIDLDLLYSKIKMIKGEEEFGYEARIESGIQFSKSKNIDKYCKVLKEFSFRRSVYSGYDELRRLASDYSVDAEKICEEIDSILNSGRIIGRETFAPAHDLMELEGEKSIKMRTGISKWDDEFYSEGGGRELGTTELIFGRPGHGKTFYMILKEVMLAKNGNTGLHFQLEDSKGEVASRAKAILPGAENKHIINRILVDTSRNLNDIISAIMIAKRKVGIKWVSVDHLGRIKVPEHEYDRVAAMTKITNSLTDLCSDEDLFGMFSVQPNKSWKGRKGWDNLLREEDLKGASELFEDAFIVTTVFRPNLYPELREYDGGIRKVLDHKGNKVEYDSVFVTKIKSRRQQIGDEYLHLIQDGNRLSFASDIDYGSNGHSPENNLPEIGTKAPF